MNDADLVFNRAAVRRNRERAAPLIGEHGFLLREVGERLADRLDDVKRSFPLALDLGCHDGTLGRLLAGRGGIDTLIQCDLAPALAARAGDAQGRAEGRAEGRAQMRAPALAADEELLPFAPASLDLVMSYLSLHLVNDLPGTLSQIRAALRPDGLLLAALLGGDTLTELRWTLAQAERALTGQASPRVAPFADVRDLGDLLGRAGFALAVADADTITVSYADAWALMRDLRGMGQGNAHARRRRRFTRRAVLHDAAQRYRDAFGDAHGRVPCTFQVVTLTAWAPHASQPRPLRPGAAEARLADALDATEIGAGKKAEPE
jgi:SAM-dependent methyltransferase